MIAHFLSVGTATMASRVLGFARDTLIAACLGAGPLADAFVVAFRLPNLFRRLFAEGAFNSAFVPLYSRRLAEGGADGVARLAGEVFTALLLALISFSALAMVFAPALVALLAPGYRGEPTKFALTVELSRICFPYLTMVSLTAMLSGVLNAHRRFLVAASAPIVLNIVTVAALLAVLATGGALTTRAAHTLSWAVSAAGVLQFALLAVAVRASPGAFRPRWPRRGSDLPRLARLGLPGAIAAGATQINIVLGTMIASMQPGANSYLYFADRIYQLPLGVVGVAIGVVLLPEISRCLREGRLEHAAAQQNRAVAFAMMLTLPAAVALMVASRPIVAVLFERGAFTAGDTEATAMALACFGAGLPAFVLMKVFAAAQFAREDTTSPMLQGLAAMAVTIGGSLVAAGLAPGQVHVGVAAATSLGGWVAAGLAFRRLDRRGAWPRGSGLAWRLARLLGASLGMGVVLVALARGLAGPLAAPATAMRFAALAMLCLGGLVSYFALCHASGAVNLRDLATALRRRDDGTAD